MLGRELIYTAVTRAKQLLVLVGPKKALAIAVKRKQPRRWSMLRDRLQLDKRSRTEDAGSRFAQLHETDNRPTQQSRGAV